MTQHNTILKNLTDTKYYFHVATLTSLRSLSPIRKIGVSAIGVNGATWTMLGAAHNGFVPILPIMQLVHTSEDTVVLDSNLSVCAMTQLALNVGMDRLVNAHVYFSSSPTAQDVQTCLQSGVSEVHWLCQGEEQLRDPIAHMLLLKTGEIRDMQNNELFYRSYKRTS